MHKRKTGTDGSYTSLVKELKKEPFTEATCAAGRFRIADDCVPCPHGHFLANRTCTPCPLGPHGELRVSNGTYCSNIFENSEDNWCEPPATLLIGNKHLSLIGATFKSKANRGFDGLTLTNFHFDEKCATVRMHQKNVKNGETTEIEEVGYYQVFKSAPNSIYFSSEYLLRNALSHFDIVYSQRRFVTHGGRFELLVSKLQASFGGGFVFDELLYPSSEV